MQRSNYYCNRIQYTYKYIMNKLNYYLKGFRVGVLGLPKSRYFLNDQSKNQKKKCLNITFVYHNLIVYLPELLLVRIV